MGATTITLPQYLARIEGAASGMRAKANAMRGEGRYVGASELDALADSYFRKAAKIRRVGCTALLKGKHQDRSKYRPAHVKRLGAERGVGRPRRA
jgi:hypothetical protein